MKKSVLFTLSIVLILSMIMSVPVFAQSGGTGTKAPGTWVSSINIQNTGTSDATVNLQFYDATGANVLTFPVTPVIPAGGSRSLYVPTDVTGLGAGQYSVVVNSTSSLQVVANASSTVPYTAGAYNGLQANEIGTTLYFPGLYNSYYGFTSEMVLQNTTTTAATVSINFYDQATGNPAGSPLTGISIPGNATRIFAMGDITGLPSGNTAGLLSAKVTSSQALGGVANIWTGAFKGEFADYDAFVAGSTLAYAPALYKNYYGFVSSLTVQNISGSNASITITYSNGTVKNDTLLPNQAKQWYQPADSALPGGNTAGVFSAKVESTQNVVVITNVEDKTKGLLGSYNGLANATNNVGCPVTMKAFYNWFTAETVMNVGTAPTNITVTYASGQTKTFNNVPSNGTINVIELATAGSVLPDASSVSASFSSSGQPIVAVVQEDSKQRYSANPGDYLLAYSCVNQ